MAAATRPICTWMAPCRAVGGRRSVCNATNAEVPENGTNRAKNPSAATKANNARGPTWSTTADHDTAAFFSATRTSKALALPRMSPEDDASAALTDLRMTTRFGGPESADSAKPRLRYNAMAGAASTRAASQISAASALERCAATATSSSTHDMRSRATPRRRHDSSTHTYCTQKARRPTNAADASARTTHGTTCAQAIASSAKATASEASPATSKKTFANEFGDRSTLPCSCAVVVGKHLPHNVAPASKSDSVDARRSEYVVFSVGGGVSCVVDEDGISTTADSTRATRRRPKEDPRNARVVLPLRSSSSSSAVII
mmetsp:Transcript_3140/g.9578  ORF Transcript_3140/g.9578 Transcript_3140/m.9578 type:complete len:317 (-) Transcript_3140:55-1005(-)